MIQTFALLSQNMVIGDKAILKHQLTPVGEPQKQQSLPSILFEHQSLFFNQSWKRSKVCSHSKVRGPSRKKNQPNSPAKHELEQNLCFLIFPWLFKQKKPSHISFHKSAACSIKEWEIMYVYRWEETYVSLPRMPSLSSFWAVVNLQLPWERQNMPQNLFANFLSK